VTVTFLLFIAIGVALWYRRLHLMVHDPEKYERFQRAEKAFAKVQVAMTERAVRSLVAAIEGMGRLLSSKFKKA
jgi:hypothetical protein